MLSRGNLNVLMKAFVVLGYSIIWHTIIVETFEEETWVIGSF